MSKDAYYFKHDANARNDPKIKSMIRKYGVKAYGWYWVLIEILRESSDYKLEYRNFILESLAEDMRASLEETKDFIDYLCSDDVKLFTKIPNENGGPIYFYSMSLMQRMRHLDEIREKRSKAGSTRYEKWDKKEWDS